MNKELENYLKMIIPQPLEEDEYIRLLLLKAEDNSTKILFLKSFEEVNGMIQKYKFVFHMFISLSTYRKLPFMEHPTELYRRQVIFLDFDKKDFPDFEDVSEYSKLIKLALPDLYNHCIVASGSGGYHFYIATEPAPLKEIINTNKAIAKLTTADIKAANSAQVARIPTSYNLKNPDDKKYVKIVSHVIGTEKFKPYTLIRLQNMISFAEHNNSIVIPQQEKPIIRTDFQSKFYCVEQMILLGCKAGERNFALGRITAKLKTENYQYDAAKQIVLDWNKRCSPPKTNREVEDDFNRYWNNSQYKLLGCNLDDERKRNILEKYCDKVNCLQYSQYEIKDDSKNIIFVSEKLLNKRNLRRLNGDHYLIIFMLIVSGNQLDKKCLITLLKGFYDRRKYVKLLQELQDYKIIEATEKEFKLKTVNQNYDTKIRVKITFIKPFLKSKISKTDVVVYLALCILLQTKNNATYDSLSDYLDKEKSSISSYIHNLNQNNIIKIEKKYNEKGLLYNRYTFI